jgi:uncharacterized protein with GYD domain
VAHFLFRASYSQQGLQGLLKEGAKSRVKVLTDTVAAVGGKLDAMYWSFGDEDVILLVEAPDNIAAAALSTRVSATGAASVSTTVLLTAAEVDKARKLKSTYRPPGG